jgi:hypothetical protein
MFGAKAQIAALEKGLDFDLVMVSYDSQLGQDRRATGASIYVVSHRLMSSWQEEVCGGMNILVEEGWEVDATAPRLLAVQSQRFSRTNTTPWKPL